MKQVLTIAASDSGGGAGIQADIKAIHANGAYALSVITSVTAQNTVRVDSAYDLPPAVVEAQLRAVFADFEIAAVKTGMLAAAEIVAVVAGFLRERRVEPLVVDPVMVAKSGYPLLDPQARGALVGELLPLATLVTPNLPEAEALAGIPVRSEGEAAEAAARIRRCGCRAVLIKGGHREGKESTDLLFDGEEVIRLVAPRLPGRHTHGTGCTLSAAIAAQLASGRTLAAAVRSAKEYLTEAIRHAPGIGHGQGPVHHFYFLEGRR
ncbi:MAG: bifunctional hydroxymethylpyrimidine kinase/phosphomethylpyrimidine kinase [Candidatus Latescibacterota bacterium]